MTRFSLTMDEALDFILNATKFGKGSEIFIPKVKAYSILDVKQALIELFGDTETKIIGIRPGEKLHETLINFDEMRYSWDFKNMYMITNPIQEQDKILQTYSGIKKIEDMETYSSNVTEKISKEEIKKIIQQHVNINK